VEPKSTAALTPHSRSNDGRQCSSTVRSALLPKILNGLLTMASDYSDEEEL
jgi:hypothetical protein